jgi:hypothetical protein
LIVVVGVPSAHKSKARPAVNMPPAMLRRNMSPGKAVDRLEMLIEQSCLLG